MVLGREMISKQVCQEPVITFGSLATQAVCILHSVLAFGNKNVPLL